MKHHVVIVYQTVPPQGISYQICRNLSARKIYLHINIPNVSSALKKKKKLNKKMIRKQELFYIYFLFLVVLFIMHILRNSQLRKLMSNLKKMKEGEGSE